MWSYLRLDMIAPKRRYECSRTIVTQSTYAVVVGAGGAGAGSIVHVAGSDGSDSSFGGIVATGGGRE